MFTAAVLIRELLVIPLIFSALIYLIRKNKITLVMAIPCLIIIIFLFIHSGWVSHQFLQTPGLLTPRLSGGKGILLVTLAFGSWEYLLYRMRIFLFFYLISLAGLLRLILLEKNNLITPVLLGFFVLSLSFLFIGSSIYNDYWGILYIPFVLISSPYILKYI